MKKDKKEIPMWAQTGHKKPVTRREFLSAGLIPFAAQILLPSIVQVPFRARAQASTNQLCAFVNIQLAGGAAMGGNFVPHNVGREPLSNYDIMGLGNTPPPIETFGGAPFAGNGISRILTGIKNQTTVDARARVSTVVVCHTSRDDSAENEMDVTGLVQAAGLDGVLLPALGNGFRFNPAYIQRKSPLTVRNVGTVRDAIGLTGALGRLEDSTQLSIMSALKKIYDSQSEKLVRQPAGETLKETLIGAGVRNEELLELGPEVVNPLRETALGGIWGINAGTSDNDSNKISATLIYNALEGQSGPASIQLGGYDYHNGTRTLGDTKDFEAGELIGRVIQSAHVMEKKVFILVQSDGAVSSDRSASVTSPWRGDRGLMGASYMIVYDPNGAPETSDFQVGHYNSNQAVDTDYFIGASPLLASAAVFANYLAVNNKMDAMSRILPSAFSTKQLEEIIKFGV